MMYKLHFFIELHCVTLFYKSKLSKVQYSKISKKFQKIISFLTFWPRFVDFFLSLTLLLFISIVLNLLKSFLLFTLKLEIEWVSQRSPIPQKKCRPNHFFHFSDDYCIAYNGDSLLKQIATTGTDQKAIL